jgi:hypothetical protein
VLQTLDLFTGAVTFDTDISSTRLDSGRAYIGRRQRLAEGLLAEGLVMLDAPASGGLRTGGRLGLAWEPAPGSWLRVAAVAERNPAAASFVPTATLGLVPLRFQFRSGGRYDALMLSYDAEVGERLLLGIEHQSLRLDTPVFPTGDALVSLRPPGGRLDVTSATADWWVGRGVGIYAALVHADSRIEGGRYDGQPLPETPEWTAALGFGFLTPSRIRGQMQAVWTSERFSGIAGTTLAPVTTVDASLTWEPKGDRVQLSLDAANLFDRPVEHAFGAPPGRRQLAVNLSVRF